MLPFWRLQKVTIFVQTVKTIYAKSLKFHWHGFHTTLFLTIHFYHALLQTENNDLELSTVGHIISGWRRKGTSNFTEIINNHGLKRGTACQTMSIMSIISNFSLKPSARFGKQFVSLDLCNVGSDYCKKLRS